MVFGVDEKDVDPFQRRFAKVVNFGLAYGMEAYGLGQRLGVPTEEAREILDNYFASFPSDRPDAAVRQLNGRQGEVWGAESATDRLVVIRTGEKQAKD